MTEQGEIMEINGLQILFQIINFGVVFGAISFLLYKPVMKMLDERAKKIEEGRLAAEKSIKEKDEIENLKKKAKSQGERDAAKVFEKAEADAKELKSKLSKEAKEEIKDWKEKEMKKWEQEKLAMKKEMEKSVGDLAIAIASKVLGAQVGKKEHNSLISDSLKDLEKAL